MTIVVVNTQDVTDISSRCPHKIVNEWFLSEFLTPGVFHRERYVWDRLINWIFCTQYSLITWFYSPLVPPLRIPVSLNWDPENSRVPISSDPCPRHTRPVSAKRTEDKGVLMPACDLCWLWEQVHNNYHHRHVLILWCSICEIFWYLCASNAFLKGAHLEVCMNALCLLPRHL